MMRERVAVRSDFIVTNRQMMDSGKADELTPPLVTCHYCKRELVTQGLLMPTGGVWWKSIPNGEGRKPTPVSERCTCEQARGYWYAYDKFGEGQRATLDKERKEQEKQAWLESLADRSEIDKSFPGLTFDNYDQGDTSNRNNLTDVQKAYMKCKWYVDTYEKEIAPEEGKYYGIGLFLSGGVGTGKTHLAVATLRELTAQGVTTLAIRSSDLLTRIRNTYSDKDSLSEQMLIAMLTQVDVLLIDDLGKSKPTDWSLEQLFNIIDKRISTKKPIIVTVNYDDADLIDRLTPRYGSERGDSKTAEAIVSRLRQMCSRTPCGKIDYRQK